MLLSIPGVLTKDAVAALRSEIDAAEWIDGNATSGQQSALAKRNLQHFWASTAASAAWRSTSKSPRAWRS